MKAKLLTEVYSIDFSEAIRDEYGFYYSKDYKRLLSYKNPLHKDDVKNHWTKIIIHPNTEIICENAFKGYELYSNCILPELILPEGLKVIGANAFTESRFSSISFPKSLDTIYGNPFAFSEIYQINNNSKKFKILRGLLYNETMNCLIHCFTPIESFVSDRRTTSIRDAAFANQINLKTVILTNVEEIGNAAFYNCPNLEYVGLTDKLITIGEKAFKQELTDLSDEDFEYYHIHGKWKLRSIPLEISIPTNTKHIGKEAFSHVTKIKSNSPYFIINDNLLLSSDGKVIYNCLCSSKTIVIPDSVECIMGSAFEGIQSIERLIIPPNIKYIGDEAFRYCYNLKSVHFETNDIKLGKSVFSNCISLKYITLPNNIKEIPERTFFNCPSVNNIVLPNTIVRIGEYAFDECSFQELKMPKELKIIEDYAFQDCKKLKSLQFNDNIEVIGSFAFSFCDKIEELYLPKSIKKIGAHTFNIQKKVTISNPSMLMGDHGVGSRKQELIIQIPTRYVWDMKCYHAIKEYWHIATSFKDWTLAERLSGKEMGEYRHMHYDEYGHPVIDDKKPGTYSGDMECFISLFDNYSPDSINKIVLDKRVKYICNRAFVKEESGMIQYAIIKPVILPDKLIAIGDHAFEYTSVKNVDLPDSLEYIGDFAFKDTNLKKIIIPLNVTHIGINPFAKPNYCHYKNLMEVECKSPQFKIIDRTLYTSDMKRLIYCFNNDDIINIPNEVETIDDFAFYCLPLASINIPLSVKRIGKSAFGYCGKLEKINVDNVRHIGEDCFEGCDSLK